MKRLSRTGLNRVLHVFFETSLLLKGLFALAELGLGVGLFFVASDTIAGAVQTLTAHEISEDPTDPVAGFLLAQAAGFTESSRHFYAFYLASHGALKLTMIALLMKDVLWAYPVSIAVLIGFIAYQAYLMTAGLTPGLVLLTLLDIAVVGLALHEYAGLRGKR